MKYYIDFCTGAGNTYVNGDLDDAKREADKGAAYTQRSIKIYEVDENGERSRHPVAMRRWIGCAAGDDVEEDADIIDFGSFGYYTEWDEDGCVYYD